jgi:hypothetical protein
VSLFRDCGLCLLPLEVTALCQLGRGPWATASCTFCFFQLASRPMELFAIPRSLTDYSVPLSPFPERPVGLCTVFVGLSVACGSRNTSSASLSSGVQCWRITSLCVCRRPISCDRHACQSRQTVLFDVSDFVTVITGSMLPFLCDEGFVHC